jgi:hypothetical protein
VVEGIEGQMFRGEKNGTATGEKAMSIEFTRGIIAVLSILGILGVAGGMFYFEIPEGSKDYFLIVLTFLVAKIGTIYDYFFGSSQGSADKTGIINNLTTKVP